MTLNELKRRLSATINFTAPDQGEWWSENRKLEGNFLFYNNHCVVWAYIYDHAGNVVDEDYCTEHLAVVPYTRTLSPEKLVRRVKRLARNHLAELAKGIE